MSAASTITRSARNNPLSVRIVSYNVLSSHLASPDHFRSCRPDDLDFENRIPRVLAKLEEEINAPPYNGEEGRSSSSSSSKPKIFCLQEVSHSWAGPLHTFFANRGYHMITGLYGKSFNNYMGILIAYPTDAFETVSVDQVRLSDYREGGWPREAKIDSGDGLTGRVTAATRTIRKFADSSVRRGIKAIVGPVRGLLRLPPPPKGVPDHWHMSENRHNILLTACLRERRSGGDDDGSESESEKATFCISNYHMPCAFYAPMVMNIHADLAARRCQTLASGMPHLLVGDFNLMPDSAHYRLLTTGVLPKSDPTYPTSKFGSEWNPTADSPMRSAYGISPHGEPDFTNYAQTREDDPFIGTLDYIFLSEGWSVDGVKSIPHRDQSGGPFPTEDEPSDHLVIAADLRLGAGGEEDKSKSEISGGGDDK